MTDQVVEFVDKFVSSPAGRTKDIIPNLFTLIGYIVSLPTEKTRQIFCIEGKIFKLLSHWLTHLSLQADADTFANSADPDQDLHGLPLWY